MNSFLLYSIWVSENVLLETECLQPILNLIDQTKVFYNTGQKDRECVRRLLRHGRQNQNINKSNRNSTRKGDGEECPKK